MWIVKTDLHYYDLIDRIEKFDNLKKYKSNIDEYYIVKQNNCNENDLEKIINLKQFTLFNIDKNSELILRTE
tara:strand:- start:4006 stop:4221 length:216 start_codon:yes stop_codon:yes gene_type:complete